MRTDNLNDSIITKIIRRLEKLESSGMLNSASISYGRLRFIGGQLLGQAGAALNWIGSATFNGPFSNTGTFTNTGPFNNSGVFTNTGPFNNSGKLTNTGELEQNGPTKLNGATEITSTLDVSATTRLRGATTVEANLTVMSGGKILVTGTIPLEISNGVLTFASGGELQGNGSGVRLAASNSSVTAAAGAAFMQVGGVILAVNAAGVTATGDLSVTGDLAALGGIQAILPSSSAPALKDVKYDPATGTLYYTP